MAQSNIYLLRRNYPAQKKAIVKKRSWQGFGAIFSKISVPLRKKQGAPARGSAGSWSCISSLRNDGPRKKNDRHAQGGLRELWIIELFDYMLISRDFLCRRRYLPEQFLTISTTLVVFLCPNAATFPPMAAFHLWAYQSVVPINSADESLFEWLLFHLNFWRKSVT